jgi:hypothetical protein
LEESSKICQLNVFSEKGGDLEEEENWREREREREREIVVKSLCT